MSNDNITDLPSSGAKILPFRAATPAVTPQVTVAPADRNIVAMLENFLALAKEGKIVFAALATVNNEGVGFSSWEPEYSSPTLVTSAAGAVAYLSHRYNQAMVEGADLGDEGA